MERRRLFVAWGLLALALTVALLIYDGARSQQESYIDSNGVKRQHSGYHQKASFSEKAAAHWYLYFVLCGAGAFFLVTAAIMKPKPPST